MEDKEYIDSDLRLNIKNLFHFLWENKIPIFSITSAFAIFSVWYALSITNVYTSTATLIPTFMSESNEPQLGALSGLSRITGINSISQSMTQSLIGKELLKSTEFIDRFVRKNDLLVPIMAANGWDIESDILIINPKIYDQENWVRKPVGLYKSEPSANEVFQEFSQRLTYEKSMDGVITLSFTFFSPKLSKQYLTLLINEVNQEVRERDIKQAELKKTHLIEQYNSTSQVKISNLFAGLIEEEIKTIMLAEVNRNYVYSVLDSPTQPENRSGVSRALICIFTTIMGIFASLAFVVIRNLIKS